MFPRGILRSLLFAVACVGLGSLALADSWLPPAPKTAVSRSGEWSASMTPGEFGEAATIRVSRKAAPDAGGWVRKLVTTVAPNDLFVSDTGAVVTLGEWHSEGYDHAVVIYDAKGRLVAERELEEFLNQEELGQVERSVSSRWWRYRGEEPEFVGEEFTLTTAWGTTLRFHMGTGNRIRDQGVFGRFRRYCEGTRSAREAVIYVSRAWKEGEHYTGRHCELRREGASCQDEGERYLPSRPHTKVKYRPRDFDQILRDAASMASYIVDDGTTTYDRAFIQIELIFGDSIGMSKWGFPEGGDTYRLKYKPLDVTPAAREWTKRLEKLVRVH